MTELEIISIKFLLVMMLKNIPLVLIGVFTFLLVSSMIKSQGTNKPITNMTTVDIISKLPSDSISSKIKQAYLLTEANANEAKYLKKICK